MNIEERLKDALAHEAARIEPSPDALDRIEEGYTRPGRARRVLGASSRRRWGAGVLAAAAALLVVAVVATSLGEDDPDVVAGPSTTTSTTAATTTTTTTTAVTTTSTTAAGEQVDPANVAFPSPASSRRFDSPLALTQAFATDVLGFTRLVLGEYRGGDARSGEVPISDRDGGPETTVLVRQMGDGTWYALGALTQDTTVATPADGAAVTSPFRTTGEALAYEGHVTVTVRTADDPQPLGQGFVTGGGGPAAPFDGEIEFDAPAADTHGIVVYSTESGEDGHVMTAATVRVVLRPGGGDGAEEARACDDPIPTRDPSTTVLVFFGCDRSGEPAAAVRNLPAGEQGRLRFALEQLVGGPTQAERAGGFTSPLDAPGTVRGVTVNGVEAVVDLATPAGVDGPPAEEGLALLGQLEATITQFEAIEHFRLWFDGSCRAAADWAGRDDCLFGL